MTVYLVVSLPKVPYTHRIYMVLANPSYGARDEVEVSCYDTHDEEEVSCYGARAVLGMKTVCK